ncbi:MAG: hypothetical protein Q9201_003869 [Fulgogasparrea decipioides]
MQSESAVSPSSSLGGGVPLPLQRHSRKRSRDESGDDYAAASGSKMSKSVSEPGPPQGADVLDRPHGAVSSTGDPTGTGVEDQFGAPLQGSPNSLSSISSEGAKERRRERRNLRRHEIKPSFSTTDGIDSMEELRQSLLEPSQDPMSLELGVGWKSMSEDPDHQAAARGWAKFIERRFVIDTVTVLAKHNSESVLARASDGFYIFTPDLEQGAFVAKDWPGVVKDLRGSSTFWFGGRELLQQVDGSGFAQPRDMKNAEGQPVDSSSAESIDDLPSTPSPSKYPPIPWTEDAQRDLDMDMVVD